MPARKNRQWLLKSRPLGMVSEANFEMTEGPVPEPGDGEVLVRTLYISFDPAMRGWMEDRVSYMPPVQIGETMRAGAIGQVVESRSPEFAPGDLVQGMFGWQEWSLASGARGGGLTRVPPGPTPTLALSVFGITGLTAYFGLLDLGQPRPGETVVVSGAAGATGSIAGQIAKIHGCRAVGIAGGPEKCEWLTRDAGFDAAIDYKSEPVPKRLAELCPDGIDIFFDNVGGEILDAALAHIAQRARIVLCGGISRYNEKEPPAGPRNYMNLVARRGRMEGFIVLDYASRFGEAVKQLAEWIAAGRIVYKEDIQEGFENAPKTFLRLFTGENFGKQILKVAEPEIL